MTEFHRGPSEGVDINLLMHGIGMYNTHTAPAMRSQKRMALFWGGSQPAQKHQNMRHLINVNGCCDSSAGPLISGRSSPGRPGMWTPSRSRAKLQRASGGA